MRHGVLDRPDPHRVDDRARLMAQIEMDSAVEDLRRRHQQQQQVLQKPNLNPEVKKPGSSSKSSSRPKSRADGGEMQTGLKAPSGLVTGNRRKSSSIGGQVAQERIPVVQGGQDPEEEVRAKRNKVVEVRRRKIGQTYCVAPWDIRIHF